MLEEFTLRGANTYDTRGSKHLWYVRDEQRFYELCVIWETTHLEGVTQEEEQFKATW